MVDKEYITKEIESLKQQQTQALAQANALQGAIAAYENILSRMNEETDNGQDNS